LSQRQTVSSLPPGFAAWPILVEGDQPFLTALLQTWEAAQMPQASTIAAGANPPKPSGTVEFRW